MPISIQPNGSYCLNTCHVGKHTIDCPNKCATCERDLHYEPTLLQGDMCAHCNAVVILGNCAIVK